MNNLENRVGRLEKQTIKGTGGREMVIKFKDGSEKRFSEGSPPFDTTTLTVVYDQTAEERKEYEGLMKALMVRGQNNELRKEVRQTRALLAKTKDSRRLE